jgi:hypothetical protein
MSATYRNSGYERQKHDLYVTPQWVYDGLYKVEKFPGGQWECAPINATFDFLDCSQSEAPNIVTNPPFSLSDKFAEHAIALTKESAGKVALLLPVTWDCAKKRIHLFDRPFKCKYIFIKRIRWENVVQKKNPPMHNHAWYVWDWSYEGPRTFGWLT